MTITVKISKIENGMVYYQEISNDGRVMIEDYMESSRFQTAVKLGQFRLVKMNKSQAVKTARLFGAIISGWYYCRPLATYEATVNNSVGIGGMTPAQLCEQAIIYKEGV